MRITKHRIYEIGNTNTVIIQEIDKQTNKIIESFIAYKSNRRKNILFIKSYTGTLKLTFNSINRAKKYHEIINNKLNEK